ncbi:MAG: isoamylase early set domain-containing protein [Anaerolineales bacterium]
MLKKTYSKTRTSCRVTFSLPAAVHAQEVCLCGDFNDWNKTARQLKRRKDGSFAVTLSLKPGHEYRFRYLLDGERWENDWQADAYVPNEYGSEDSLVRV